MLRTVLALILSFGLAASPAVAKGAGQGHGGRKKVVFNGQQRGVVGTYFASTYGRGQCPPGLAKKNNGCLPPGQAKKLYTVGQRLPRGVIWQPLPPILLTQLGAAPYGYQYGIVDGDVLLLALGTRLVVDVIRALD